MSTLKLSWNADTRLGLLMWVYFLSGVTGLAYEIMWSRLISLQFGLSVFGVISVVTSFMAGLGLGALIANRHQKIFAKKPFWFMAVIELLVAGYALLLLPLLNFSWSSITLAYPNMSTAAWLIIQFIVVVLVLTLPALLMGMGFAIMVSCLKGQLGAGKIYGINTLGAVIGALLPLWLLPQFGWLTAHYLIIVINALLALCFYIAHVKYSYQAKSNDMPASVIPFKVLCLYSLVGALAIIIELLWIRLFGLILLRTEYVMAIIIALYLSGIGLGSLLFSRLQAYSPLLTAIPYIIALMLLLSLYCIPWLSAWNEAAEYTSLSSALLWQGLAVALLTLPITLLLGAWYPLLIARYQSCHHVAIQLYAVNSIGAAIGAIIFGGIFLPLLGSILTMVCIAVLIFLLGIAWNRQWKMATIMPLIFLLAWPVSRYPQVAELLPKHYGQSTDMYRYENALALNHVIRDPQGERFLLSDLRRVDASSEYTAVETQKNQARLALLLHEDPKSVLFLGLGTGITAAGSLPYELERTAVELSVGAIRAAQQWFAKVNGNVTKTMNVVQDDIRRFLINKEARYDVIIGDLFHPDLLGRGALLSVEQFSRSKSRLKQKGLFVQWLALNQYDSHSLNIVMASFAQVFAHNALFIDGTRLALVGFDDAWAGNGILDKFRGRINEDFATGGEGSITWLGRYLGRVQKNTRVVQSEWYPIIEYQLPKAKFSQSQHVLDNLQALMQSRDPIDKVLQRFPMTEKQKLTQAYAATNYLSMSLMAALKSQNEQAQRYARLAYKANGKDRWASFRWADYLFANLQQTHLLGISQNQLLNAVLTVRPDHKQAIKVLWQMEKQKGNGKKAHDLLQRLDRLTPYEDLSSLP